MGEDPLDIERLWRGWTACSWPLIREGGGRHFVARPPGQGSRAAAVQAARWRLPGVGADGPHGRVDAVGRDRTEGCGSGDGVTALQVKGGVEPERDIEVIGELRGQLGPYVWLRLDANQGYGAVASGVKVLRRPGGARSRLRGATGGGRRRLAQVRYDRRQIPVIADETCWDARSTLRVRVGGAMDATSIYLAKAGGITGARKLAAVARQRRLPCDVNGSLEAGWQRGERAFRSRDPGGATAERDPFLGAAGLAPTGSPGTTSTTTGSRGVRGD